MKKTLFSISFIFLSFTSFSYAQDEVFIREIQAQWKKLICRISWVDDGDTINLSCTDGNYESVRLLGINAPDKNLSSNIENCYYQAAKKYLEQKVGIPLVVIFYGSDLCKDPYKWCRNLVRLIDIRSNMDIGQNMILHGLAFSWTSFSMIPSQTKLIYDWMERISSNHQLGLWWECSVQYQDVSTIDSPTPTKMTLP